MIYTNKIGEEYEIGTAGKYEYFYFSVTFGELAPIELVNYTGFLLDEEEAKAEYTLDYVLLDTSLSLQGAYLMLENYLKEENGI